MYLKITRFICALCIWFIVDSGRVICRANRICSWYGSSNVSRESNTVKVVEVNCTEGKIEWKYPKGALMVEIVPPISNVAFNEQWKLCIRPTQRHRDALLFYLDSDQRQTFCEPCRTTQLLDHFCKADIVFKGVLLANGENYVRFIIEKFIRKPITTIDDDNDVFTRGAQNSTAIKATVFTPNGCHLTRKLESMEFLVVAKLHLGRAHALCIPLWSDWMTIWRSTLMTSSNNGPTVQPAPCDVT